MDDCSAHTDPHDVLRMQWPLINGIRKKSFSSTWIEEIFQVPFFFLEENENLYTFSVIYRTADYVWNEPTTGQALRAASPVKTKLTTSARPLANGILHESSQGLTSANSLLQAPSSSSPIVSRDENNQQNNHSDLFLSSAAKNRQQNKVQRTNSHSENKANGFIQPNRSESYRSSNFDYALRGRHTSSKQRSYVNSKASSHDVTPNDFHQNNSQDETLNQSSQIISNNQRMNVSSFDLTTSRKAFSPNKSISFNFATNGVSYRNSPHDLRRSETNLERNNLTRFALRGTVPKEQNKGNQTASNGQMSSATPGPMTTNERHPSAQSYKSRDPNISYAYNDVKKYIEENDLMSAEKEQCIRNWVIDVEKYRGQLQKIE